MFVLPPAEQEKKIKGVKLKKLFKKKIKISVILYKKGDGKNLLVGAGVPASPPVSATACCSITLIAPFLSNKAI